MVDKLFERKVFSKSFYLTSEKYFVRRKNFISERTVPLGGELAVVHLGGTQLKFRASALETYWSHRIRSYGQKDII